MIISVCVGSSCHLHGSTTIIQTFQELIKEHCLEGQVELRGVFCQGRCTEPVAVVIDTKELGGVTVDTAVHIFRTEVLTKVVPS